MRTTLAIDDDVLSAAKEMALMQKKSLGEVVSSLARSALTAPTQARRMRNGVLLLPIQPGSRPVTTELVKQLEEELL